LPRAAEREFIAAANIQAVYVAALPSGPSFVSTSRDLLHLLIALRRRWNGIRIISAHWVEGKTEAWLICREVNASLPRGAPGLLVANAKAAQRCVENGGARMNITLTDHADVLHRASAAVAFVESHIREAEAKGELRWLKSGLSDVAARGQGGRPLDDVCRSTRAVPASNVSRSAVVRVRRSFKIHFPTAANIKFGLTASNRGCSPHARRRAAKCALRLPPTKANPYAGFQRGRLFRGSTR
jgi:hypothetical protein